MITQIYSIQSPQEALDCINAGADRIGVLVGEPDGPFPCAVSEETCREIYDAIGNKAMKVLISVREDPEEILKETALLKPDVLHLCANYDGNAEFKKELNERIPGVLLMKRSVWKIDQPSLRQNRKRSLRIF